MVCQILWARKFNLYFSLYFKTLDSLLHFEIINKIDDFNLSEESSEFVKELFDIKILQSVNELLEPIIQRKINSLELQMFEIETVSLYEILTNNLMSSNKIRVPKELNYLKEEDFFVIFFIVILIGSFKKEFLRKARCIPIESYRILGISLLQIN
ncbi:hypothetical protein BpHYR1_004373 [Brachionus plicatilis]|uniref:Uncharacterized protein n=1 Tax=Brachionus plicatilis TaxID=10195 RepID=A0A3M7Q4P4_BRAPC|nr:hypothetical protein BpHYR1_004373 [Brachionus plicatilis]